jgi:hypothetical protein
VKQSPAQERRTRTVLAGVASGDEEKLGFASGVEAAVVVEEVHDDATPAAGDPRSGQQPPNRPTANRILESWRAS